jgi:hypothetical protein
LWDYFFHLALRHGQPGWARTDEDAPECQLTFAVAAALANKSNSKEYIDAHNWVFVPASFELIILCLARLGLTDWQVARSDIADLTEFYIWLKRGGKAEISAKSEEEFSQLRQRFLETTMLQLGEHSRSMSLGIAANTERQVQANDTARRVSQLQADLDSKNSVIAAMRATRTWNIRVRLRRMFGVKPTVADK